MAWHDARQEGAVPPGLGQGAAVQGASPGGGQVRQEGGWQEEGGWQKGEAGRRGEAKYYQR